MLSEQLLSDLLKLSRAEKLQAMQVLINDLNAEEIASAPMLEAAGMYDSWSQCGAIESAGRLWTKYSDFDQE